MGIWKKLDLNFYLDSYITRDDTCAFAREYTSRGGYGASRTNSNILNFKKSPLKKGTLARKYRTQAINLFAKEVGILFPPNSKATITAIPSSKPKTHKEYDYRFEDLFKVLLKTHPHLNIEWPVETKKFILSAHKGGSRNPEDIKKNYKWKGFKNTPEKIGILDDVLTTGAHFRAMSDFLKKNKYQGKIIGLFWSRTVR